MSLEFRSANLERVNWPFRNDLKSVLARKSYRASNFGLMKVMLKKRQCTETMDDARWTVRRNHRPLCHTGSITITQYNITCNLIRFNKSKYALNTTDVS